MNRETSVAKRLGFFVFMALLCNWIAHIATNDEVWVQILLKPQYMPSWWNGIHNRLRNGVERRVGSSPTEGTNGWQDVSEMVDRYRLEVLIDIFQHEVQVLNNPHAEMVELVVTLDLKSSAPKGAWGFESLFRYQILSRSLMAGHQILTLVVQVRVLTGQLYCPVV